MARSATTRAGCRAGPGAFRHDRHCQPGVRPGHTALRIVADDRLPVAGIRVSEALKVTTIMLIPMLAVLAMVILSPEMVLFPPRLNSPERVR